MAKRPTSFRLDNTTVKVRWNAKLGRAGKFPKAGDHDSKTDTISIAHGLTERAQRGTLLHELMHALWDKAKLQQFYSEVTEETVVDSLSGWLLDSIQENPELFDYLKEA